MMTSSQLNTKLDQDKGNEYQLSCSDTTFPTNPQYQFEIEDDKTTQVQDKYTVVIGLMQKELRKKKLSGGKAPSIGYMIYKVRVVYSLTKLAII